MHHHVAVAILHSRHYLFPIASHFNTHFSLPSTYSCAGEKNTYGDFVHTNNKYIFHLRRGMTPQTHSVQPIYGSAKALWLHVERAKFCMARISVSSVRSYLQIQNRTKELKNWYQILRSYMFILPFIARKGLLIKLQSCYTWGLWNANVSRSGFLDNAMHILLAFVSSIASLDKIHIAWSKKHSDYNFHEEFCNSTGSLQTAFFELHCTLLLMNN